MILRLHALHLTPELIANDRFVQWAVTTPLYNIGEYASHLSKELQALRPGISWSKVAGLRHRLVHDYEGTNWRIVIQVIFEDYPSFIKQVRTLLPENSSQ